ncbi:hypothetical protein [Streptomyces lasalocidi]|uniref:Uncharacterized protein n=1 Tax=Streptomyces lasalocidi TaxID=324833 RepID=A0A4U5WPW8_STRLS|nr:hypothetical protein [Streptomyces lasalocidi]TKT04318.1 hypothetical protein E4U91_32645 [Streptomyces lasalocidi]
MADETKVMVKILAYVLLGCACIMALSVIVMLFAGANFIFIDIAPLVAAGCGLLLLRLSKSRR